MKLSSEMGSPPHTRGKVVASEFDVLIAVDHPRTRGEKRRRKRRPYAAMGSPPHTRGKVSDHNPIGGGCRITPAHAGKSSSARAALARSRDHPRTRGEKSPTLPAQPEWVGSPPHTRGKVDTVTSFSASLRITPAHAGKSLYEKSGGVSVQDHPRTRGEKT